MSLSAGDKLGPYEVLSLIGKGGMGEVYRAHDPRLNRDVAVKVSNAQFTERFTREARTIAALNHTNICHLYDVGPNYLVMEYVEGNDLRGPLDLNDALPIIRQLIDGIEAAHEKNIVHRDLKPANIKITPEGVVKILDFGLAKAMEPPPSNDGTPDNSPTLTMGMTQAGAILGTAAYMSPEQAKGKIADRRADIWSFGIVLYELLVGKKLFAGDSVVEILGGVLNKDPDLSAAPPRVQKLLRWCLEKDRKHRLQSIGDARILLDEGLSASEAAAVPVPSRSRFGALPWAVAGVAILVAAVAFWAPWRVSQPADRPLVRLNLDLPGWVEGAFSSGAFTLSPDGARVVYRQLGTGNAPVLATRLLEESESHILPGTEGATAPFFSPDGQWVGFFQNGKLQKTSIRGGAPIALATAPGSFGASWGEDGFIVAALNVASSIMRIPETGGEPEEFIKRTEVDGRGLSFPQHLPGGKAILFANNPAGIYVKDLAAPGKPQRVIENATSAQYLPSGDATGHLVYVSQGTLFALPFDPARLAVLGPPQPVLNDVVGSYSFSNTGTFLYRIGQAGEQVWPVHWMESTGMTRPLLATPAFYTLPTFSPDPAGRFLAVVKGVGGVGELLVYDWKNDVTVNLTRPGNPTGYPAWSPDGQHLAMFTPPNGVDWMRSDGSGETHRILQGKNSMLPTSISPDGKFIALSESNPDTLLDLWVAPLDLSKPDQPVMGEPKVLLKNPGNDFGAIFSPDGKWLAYFSDVSGRYEVYVQPFPGPGAPRNVSVNEGAYPAWSSNGRELFFSSLGSGIQVVDYHVEGAAFIAKPPRTWSNTRYRSVGTIRNWGLHPDGKRIAMFPEEAVDPASTDGPRFGFLLNFFDELRRRAPASGE